MGMALKLANYLRAHPVPFELVRHAHSASSMESAETMQVAPERLAKAVVLEDDNGRLLMAVLPASRTVKLDKLRSRTGRTLRLATEEELRARFTDCELGAVPPLGTAYGIETIWDDSLTAHPELYFEAGDHETLVRVKTSDFVGLLEAAQHLDFSVPMRAASARPLF